MNKKIIRFLCVVLSVVLLYGCAPQTKKIPSTPTTVPENTTTPQETDPIKDTEPGFVPSPSRDPDTGLSVTADVGACILDNAYEATQTNAMFSPLSFEMALALVAEGAAPEYAEYFAGLIGPSDYAQFAKEYEKRLEELNRETDANAAGTFPLEGTNGYKTVFEIANSLWVNNTHDIADTYLKAIENYDVQIEKVNFKDAPAVVGAVNQWTAEKTRDLIKEIIKEQDIKERTQAIVVNAVYFEAPWQDEWTVLEEKQVFTDMSGNKTDVKTISQWVTGYCENEYATAFSYEYVNGLRFYGILPKEEGEFSVQAMDIDGLLKTRSTAYDVYAQMPTFKFENRIENIVEVLTAAGYGKLFDPEDGMFTEILTKNGEPVALTISDIIQADAIELDEAGTKAAAVTAIIMNDCAAALEPKEVKRVILDRPFAFVIYDPVMEQIVFMGKVVTVS